MHRTQHDTRKRRVDISLNHEELVTAVLSFAVTEFNIPRQPTAKVSFVRDLVDKTTAVITWEEPI